MFVKRFNFRFFVNIKDLWGEGALNGFLTLPFTIPVWNWTDKWATHYSQTITTTHGRSKSFTKKILSSQNTMKTVLTLFVNRPKFCAWVYFFSLREKSLWVCLGDCSPGKTRRTVFCEKKFHKTPSTYYSWCVPILLFCLSYVVVCE